MTDNEIKTGDTLKQKIMKIGIFAIALIIAFMLGFIPMWIKASNAAKEHENTKQLLGRSEISNLISKAIVDARRGEYETARQSTSDFYTKLNTEIESADNTSYSASEETNLKAVFTDRDAIITMLAQRDPASVERLSDIYLSYRQALGETITKTAVQSPSNTNTSANK